MPTQIISDKDAKKVAALARAREWRDNKRGEKSPATKTIKSRSDTPKSSSKKKKKPVTLATNSPTPVSTKSKAEKRASISAVEIQEEDEPPAAATAQYRKTPSRDDRAKARATARANARKWSEQRKRKNVLHADEAEKVEEMEVEMEVPAVVETEDVTGVSDDFKTAAGTEAHTGIVVEVDDMHELNRLKGDCENAFKRMQNICEKYNEKVEAMDY